MFSENLCLEVSVSKGDMRIWMLLSLKSISSKWSKIVVNDMNPNEFQVLDFHLHPTSHWMSLDVTAVDDLEKTWFQKNPALGNSAGDLFGMVKTWPPTIGDEKVTHWITWAGKIGNNPAPQLESLAPQLESLESLVHPKIAFREGSWWKLHGLPLKLTASFFAPENKPGPPKGNKLVFQPSLFRCFCC